MLPYLFRRLVAVAVLVVGISLVTFALVRMVPGDPVALYYGGMPVDADIEQALRRQWGLDQPLPVQYLRYLGGVLQGNLGVSLATGRPIMDDLVRRFPATVELTLAGVLLALVVGLPLGVIAALHRNRLIDHLLRIGSLVSLGKFSTVGNMMGGLVRGDLFIEGWYAKLMYTSLYKMHELALHGWAKVILDTLARTLTRRTEPQVKLH